MTDGEDRVPDAIRRRLEDHAAQIVRVGAVPQAERDDLVEELAGHLDAAYRAARAGGLTADEAAARAISSFGGVDAVARELQVTYRGRLWASTIGQLLPLSGIVGTAPGVVVWLVRFDRFIAILSLIAAAAFLLLESPVRAVVAGLVGVLAALAIWLAATALSRGQRWAIPVSAYVCLVNAVIFFVSLGQPPGGFTLSINGLIGVVLLVALAANLGVVEGWASRSRPLPGRLGWPIALVVLAWSLIVAISGRIPDPTQIGPDDVRATASVTCTVPTSRADDGKPFVPTPTITMDIAYDRTDAAPAGVLRDAAAWGDVIEVAPDPGWASRGDVAVSATDPGGQPHPLDIGTIVVNDTSPRPNVIWEIGDQSNPQIGEILGVDQRAGRVVRIVVSTVPELADDRPAGQMGTPVEGMSVTVAVHHLDRFTLAATLYCGQSARLAPIG